MKAIFLAPAPADLPAVRPPFLQNFIIALLAFATLFLGLMPGVLLDRILAALP